ncbi:MAG: hypothetical protein HYT14_00980, partial [Candidatus Liptonbacteria bacterium]|nr:hypothetical protein [Candidatus Liptonbacteria bacterium]
MLIRYLGVTVVVLLSLALFFSFLAERTAPSLPLPLNDLALKVSAGEVAKIVIAGDDLKVTLKDGTMMNAKKEAEAG